MNAIADELSVLVDVQQNRRSRKCMIELTGVKTKHPGRLQEATMASSKKPTSESHNACRDDDGSQKWVLLDQATVIAKTHTERHI